MENIAKNVAADNQWLGATTVVAVLAVPTTEPRISHAVEPEGTDTCLHVGNNSDKTPCSTAIDAPFRIRPSDTHTSGKYPMMLPSIKEPINNTFGRS
jgi:hypothetical protein